MPPGKTLRWGIGGSAIGEADGLALDNSWPNEPDEAVIVGERSNDCSVGNIKLTVRYKIPAREKKIRAIINKTFFILI